MLEFCLLDADYVIEKTNGEEKPVIRLFGKTKNGKSVLVLDRKFEPYFYAVPKNLKKAKTKIEKTKGVKRVEIIEKIIGRNIFRINFILPSI